MNNYNRCETSDHYFQVTAIINPTQRIIRCRHDIQWIVQKRTSKELNKGHWVGQSYHTTWESLKAHYSGVVGIVPWVFKAPLMPNKKPYKQRKRGSPKFVMISHSMADTAAWRKLKPAPRALYLEIKRRYNGYNNGSVLLSHRDAAKSLNSNYNSVGSWFRKLEKHGFIVCMQKHHLGPSGVGQTSHWRLTEYDCYGHKATHDYLAWKSKEN